MVKNKFLILIMALSISMFILTGCFQSDINNANNVDDKNQSGTEQTDNTQANNTQMNDTQMNDTQMNDTQINDTQTDDTQTNDNKTEFKLDFVKQVENLEISNIVLNKKSGSKVELTANVKNTSMEFSESKIIEITAIDKNGETISIFSGLVSKLAAQEETKFVTQVLKDITMAEDLKFTLVK